MSATPATVALGSGTHVALENLQAGLERLGHDVIRVGPARPLAGGWFAARRLLFNLSLAGRHARGCDLICGFDLDGWRLAGRATAPFVAWLHGVVADEARFERGLTRWSLGLQARAERRSARRAAMVLAPSRYSAGRIAELYGVPSGAIRVVAPGFDRARWNEALARGPVARHESPTILCVGRMYPRKNHAALLRATAALLADRPDVRLRIVGDGPERRRLERLAAQLGITPAVRFTGQLSFEELVGEYAACDVFCLPTLQEGYGMVFAEAMTAGKPIVACRAGATPELVRDEVDGLLCPPDSIASLTAALAELLRDPARRARLGEAGRARAAALFGIERAAESFVKTVAPLAKKGVRPNTLGFNSTRSPSKEIP